VKLIFYSHEEEASEMCLFWTVIGIGVGLFGLGLLFLPGFFLPASDLWFLGWAIFGLIRGAIHPRVAQRDSIVEQKRKKLTRHVF
jgi:hypothetical protein